MPIIYGSWGTIACDETGRVTELRDESQYEEGERGYRDIVRIDVEEWRRTYPNKSMDHCDILDCGYWTTDGTYEPPAYEWRKDYRTA